MSSSAASWHEARQDALHAQAEELRRVTPAMAANGDVDMAELIREQPLLNRPYRMVAFDWDGTAVPSREHPTDALRQRTEALAREGVWLAVITGTNMMNLVEQYFHLLGAEARRRHLACVNRGSEVIGFDEDGHQEVLHRRTATPGENHRMDQVARAAHAELRTYFGLDTRVVFRRFNRRKLDLIPTPEWSDPPKARIDRLLAAVSDRLAQAGIEGGIRQVMDRVSRLAEDKGIALRLTSDVKHVEFGLTDKSDSMTFLLDEFAPSHGISTDEILVLGDEFGPIDDLEGSDFRTFRSDGPCYASVGREPNGVPEGVLHVGGGAELFGAILDRQIEFHKERT